MDKAKYELHCFTAAWCKSCREQKEKFIDWKPAVPLFVHDIDKKESFFKARELKVTDVPTTVLLSEDGTPVQKWIDVTDPTVIDEYISNLLTNNNSESCTK